MTHFIIDDYKMKLTRLILSLMVAAVMTPVYADNNDPQQQADNSEAVAKQRAAVAAQAMASSQGRGLHFMPIPTVQPVPQSAPPPIQNRPVEPARDGNNSNNNLPVARGQTAQTPDTKWVGRDRNHQDNLSDNHQDNRRYYQHNHESRRINDTGFSGVGEVRTRYLNDDINHNDSVSYGYIRPNNTTVIYSSRVGIQDVRDNDGFRNRGWVNHYRMPYRSSNDGRYNVRYVRSWPNNYGWRVHGWRENYRVVDPYWFAVITSIAVAQAWSDAEIAQAINDDNLRQQLLYDADLRRQMVDSGYPTDQLTYLDYGSNRYASSYPEGQGASYSYNQSSYRPQYSQGLGTTQTIQTTESSYYLPPSQSAPRSATPGSPLYTGNQALAMPSGEQIANLNANKNALFFCGAGNRQSTAFALRSVTQPDMSVWKTVDAYSRCAMWASAP